LVITGMRRTRLPFGAGGWNSISLVRGEIRPFRVAG
jgi:hypothetical protein